MRYPIKTPGQLPLVLKGFRKARGITQAAMAQRLGITQQSYAHFEANPASATLDRLFVVLRIMDVEINLDQIDSAASATPTTSTRAVGSAKAAVKATGKTAPAKTVIRKALSSVSKPARILPVTRKQENW